MDGNASKTVYLPVSLRSLGRYNKQWIPMGAGPMVPEEEEEEEEELS